MAGIQMVIKEIGIGLIDKEVRSNFKKKYLRCVTVIMIIYCLIGFRDSQNNQGGNNYYQNQNGYQSRNDRNNEYSGKGNPDFRDNTYKERGDFNRDNRDGYGGGGRFKGGNSTRGSNMKGPLDRSDRQGQGN